MTKRVRFTTPITQVDIVTLEWGTGWKYDFAQMVRSQVGDEITYYEPLKWCGISGTLFAQSHRDKPWVQVHPTDQRQYKQWLSEIIAQEILK